MGLATIAAALLNEAGVDAEDILGEAGVDRKGAVRQLASGLGVDLNDLVEPANDPRGIPVEVTEEDVERVRQGLRVLNRIFS